MASRWQRVCGASIVEFLHPQPGEGKASTRPGPVLRLVPQAEQAGSAPTFAAAEPVPSVVAARRAIALENHLARGVCNPGEYEALSRAVAGSLQGGRAALLTPERRKSLVAGAVRSGLRPFEAQLIVAAVQEAVRHGEVDPVLHGPVEPLAATSAPAPARSTELDARRTIVMITASVLLAFALLALLVTWTLGDAPVSNVHPPSRGASN